MNPVDPSVLEVVGPDGEWRWMVTVTAESRRGTAKLHTFGMLPDGRWIALAMPTRKQLAAARRQKAETGVVGGWATPPGRDILDVPADALVPVSAGFAVTQAWLCGALHLLRVAGESAIEIDGLKRVVAALGSRLAKVEVTMAAADWEVLAVLKQELRETLYS